MVNKLLILFLVLSQLSAAARSVAQVQNSQKLEQRLTQLMRAKEAASAHVVVLDLSSPRIVFQHQANALVMPASILKIVPSTVLLKQLGPEYFFETEFFGLGRNGARLEALALRGSGDPSFTIEQLWLAVRKLKRLGITHVGEIVLDDSRFENWRPSSGQRAYQAGASALAFNFNSITFEVCPTSEGAPARVSVDPAEVPVQLEGSIRTAGRGAFSIDQVEFGHKIAYQLSGAISRSAGCDTIYRSVKSPLDYLGATAEGLLSAAGITVVGGFRAGRVPESAQLLYKHRSKPLSSIVWDLNNFSNNFIAEQLVYVLGRTAVGTFDHNLGVSRLEEYLAKLGFEPSHYKLADGSGLSRENRISAMALAMTLRDAYRDYTIRADFEASLPIGGRSGTVRDRKLDFPTSLIRAKTGSLNGVSSLAGYIYKPQGKVYAFVSILNGGLGYESAKRYEEQIVKAIVEGRE